MSEANFRREMISKKDFNQTGANSKSTQGERIFVTDKEREREQIIIKWKITKIREMTDKMREWPMAPFFSRPTATYHD